MKTRVSRNKELHQTIASDTESVVESSDLSHFANRLNEIDDQFNRMNVEKAEEHTLEHARQTETQIDDTLDQKLDISDNQFDTFESAYLKDFLDEVKEYNVKKGYRDLDNTSSNILKDLKLDSNEKSRNITQEELGFVKPTDLQDLESVLSEIDEDETQIYRAVDHASREDYVPAKSLDETIAMAVMSMSEEEEEIDEPVDFENTERVYESEPLASLAPVEEHHAEEAALFDESDLMTRNLLEQTQTLQFKIVDQEKSIEEMSDTMVRTNRLLNAVLSLLMLAIIVVLMFIVSNIWKG